MSYLICRKLLTQFKCVIFKEWQELIMWTVKIMFRIYKWQICLWSELYLLYIFGPLSFLIMFHYIITEQTYAVKSVMCISKIILVEKVNPTSSSELEIILRGSKHLLYMGLNGWECLEVLGVISTRSCLCIAAIYFCVTHLCKESGSRRGLGRVSEWRSAVECRGHRTVHGAGVTFKKVYNQQRY